MKKGFALDDDRLKRLGGGNYFDELLARIREIRSSEKDNMGLTQQEPMYMKDWLETIDDYPKMTCRDIRLNRTSPHSISLHILSLPHQII